jgi:hypothetical protein
MSRFRSRSSLGGFAQVLLLPLAALAVHQLRYVLAYRGHAGIMLQRTGHSYLHSITPWIMLTAALAAGGFLHKLGRAFAGHRTVSRYTASLIVLWLACAACLIAIFACQELLEGLLATGHPAGLAGVFGYGGWWAIPLAAIIGLVLAAVLHGALWVLDAVARRRRRQALWSGPARALARPGSFLLIPRAPLVGGWSGRGPPA